MKTEGTVRVTFVESQSEVPIVKFSRNGREMYGLVDTGSESTLFDDSVVDDGTIPCVDGMDTEMNLVGMNGSTGRRPMRGVSAYVDMDGNRVKVAGLSTDLSPFSNHLADTYGENLKIDAVFGSDILSWYGAKIDFANREIVLNYDLSGKQ